MSDNKISSNSWPVSHKNTSHTINILNNNNNNHSHPNNSFSESLPPLRENFNFSKSGVDSHVPNNSGPPPRELGQTNSENPFTSRLESTHKNLSPASSDDHKFSQMPKFSSLFPRINNPMNTGPPPSSPFTASSSSAGNVQSTSFADSPSTSSFSNSPYPQPPYDEPPYSRRRNASKACENCKRQHTRCSNTRPCTNCQIKNIPCKEATKRGFKEEDQGPRGVDQTKSPSSTSSSEKSKGASSSPPEGSPRTDPPKSSESSIKPSLSVMSSLYQSTPNLLPITTHSGPILRNLKMDRQVLNFPNPRGLLSNQMSHSFSAFPNQNVTESSTPTDQSHNHTSYHQKQNNNSHHYSSAFEEQLQIAKKAKAENAGTDGYAASSDMFCEWELSTERGQFFPRNWNPEFVEGIIKGDIKMDISPQQIKGTSLDSLFFTTNVPDIKKVFRKDSSIIQVRVFTTFDSSCVIKTFLSIIGN